MATFKTTDGRECCSLTLLPVTLCPCLEHGKIDPAYIRSQFEALSREGEAK